MENREKSLVEDLSKRRRKGIFQGEDETCKMQNDEPFHPQVCHGKRDLRSGFRTFQRFARLVIQCNE